MTDKSLPIQSEKIEKTTKTVGEFAAILQKEITDIDEVIFPLLKVYLNDVRDIRMAFAREVKDILQSTTELGKVTGMVKDVRELAAAILTLEQVLTPQATERLTKIFNKEK